MVRLHTLRELAGHAIAVHGHHHLSPRPAARLHNSQLFAAPMHVPGAPRANQLEAVAAAKSSPFDLFAAILARRGFHNSQLCGLPVGARSPTGRYTAATARPFRVDIWPIIRGTPDTTVSEYAGSGYTPGTAQRIRKP